ncbi:MAG TPA: exopolysaccharide biosynthesis polyprenyl glycosylphosphotransferase [Candidatus Wolfebacteria bacterium]|nr:exopolysaccharide biosynthesis polyprenyl glycosylphosphotransferase [Candidatus Wolfebacteria bacterium]
MSKIKTIIIFLGDIAILYGSLALTLLLRYGPSNFQESFLTHLKSFSLIFIIWLLVFYLADLYQNKTLKNNFSLARSIIPAITISAIISVIFFYAFTPLFNLTPKTNLLIFAFIFGIIDFIWRALMIKILIKSGWRTNLLIIDNSETITKITSYLESNPQFGYDIRHWLKEDLNNNNLKNLEKTISDNEIDIIIIPPNIIKKNISVVKFIYKLLPLKISVIDSASFYELIFQKVPIDELEESWFIEKITTRRHVYDAAKRTMDVILASLLCIILLPLIIIIAILIKATSRGTIIYKQKRTGKNGKSFTLYKFRTMRTNQDGPLWTAKDDKRLTFIGKILRHTHLDEFSQFYNIIKGDISFIGPRAERSELVEQYQKLPYYDMRHIIKPGLTGWAQVNYQPSVSLEEAFEKLQYDIYYIKNRSLFLDFLIILKTIKYLFTSNN